MSKEDNNILVIEDGANLDANFKSALAKDGFSVKSTLNIPEALVSIEEEEPDVILLGSHVPAEKEDKFIRGLEGTNGDIPILVFTDEDSPRDVESVKRIGAQRYVLKNWSSPRGLVKMVRETIKG